MEYNYCRRCGDQLQSINQQELRCGNGHSIFPAPIPGASVILVDQEKRFYLTRRAIEPDKGMLDSIGGFMLLGETAEQTAAREVEEEAGLARDAYGPFHYLSTTAQPYRYQDEERAILSINFWAQLHDSNVEITASDDAASIERFYLEDIDTSQFTGVNGELIIERLKQIADQLRDQG